MASAKLHDHSPYPNNSYQSNSYKKRQPEYRTAHKLAHKPELVSRGHRERDSSLQGSRLGTAETKRMLYFMVFRDNVLACRFCSREPSDMDRTRTRDPLSSTSVLAARCGATLSTRTLLYSRIKTRVPGRERRGNFVPKFITRSCYTQAPRLKHRFAGARTLLTFLAPLSLRALLRWPAHTRTCTRCCLLVRGPQCRTCAYARERGVLNEEACPQKNMQIFSSLLKLSPSPAAIQVGTERNDDITFFLLMNLSL